MSRHTATRAHRSKSAERAHRAGRVDRTVVLSASAPLTVRERLITTAAHNGGALAIVAATVWIYDITRVVHVV
jgi:hypothetical protein